MKRRIALAFGVLSSLSWVGGIFADEPIKHAPAPAGAPAAQVAPVIIKGDHYGPALMNPGCDHCAPQESCGGLQAGVGFYYIQPHWQNNPAVFTTATLPGGAFTVGRQDDFNYDYDFHPRAWVGFTGGDGSGARIRWWRFDDDSSLTRVDDDATFGIATAAPLGITIGTGGTAAAPETLTVTSDLQLDVWDVEGTYVTKLGCFDVTFFGGLRYTHISQSYNATVADPAGLLATLSSGHNASIYGPTGGVETRRALGGMGLTMYGSSRASLLFGHGQQSAAVLIVDGTTTGEGAAAARDLFIPVLEAEIGAEYATEMSGMRLFVQAALVGQVWFGAGGAARSSSPDSLGLLRGGVEEDSNLGFFGATISAGINY